jgi:hypothetical protein
MARACKIGGQVLPKTPHAYYGTLEAQVEEGGRRGEGRAVMQTLKLAASSEEL